MEVSRFAHQPQAGPKWSGQETTTTNIQELTVSWLTVEGALVTDLPLQNSRSRARKLRCGRSSYSV